MYKNIILIALFLFFLVSIPHPASGNLPVTPVADYRQFEITAVSPTEVYPSDVKKISITFKNTDDERAAYAVSTIINPDVTPIQVVGEQGRFGGNLIMPHDSFTVEYTVNVKDNTPKGIYYLNMTAVWSADRAKTQIHQENFYIGIKVVENPEMIKINTVSITTIPEHIHPGDQFEVAILLKNIGNTKLTQIRAFLDAERPFSAIGSSTEQYVPLLEPDQTSETSFRLQVDKQAISHLYNFNFTLEYRDSANRQQSQQGSFGVDVEEVSEIYIQDVRLDPTTLNPGTEGLLMIQIANAGTNSVKNVRITIFGGEKVLTQNQNYIGIIPPGPSASETTSFGVLVSPDAPPADYGLYIQLNYDDVAGNHFSQSNLYILKVSQPGSMIPVPRQYMVYVLYSLVFLVVGYAIFLGTGYRLEGENNSRGGRDDEKPR
jgi:uncharacterized membrane protein